MRQRRPAPISPDIPHLAQDNLGTADQVIVFGALFDAALRATHSMLLDDPRRKAVLNEALDHICADLIRTVPAQVERAPVVERQQVAPSRMKHPAPKP